MQSVSSIFHPLATRAVELCQLLFWHTGRRASCPRLCFGHGQMGEFKKYNNLHAQVVSQSISETMDMHHQPLTTIHASVRCNGIRAVGASFDFHVENPPSDLTSACLFKEAACKMRTSLYRNQQRRNQLPKQSAGACIHVATKRCIVAPSDTHEVTSYAVVEFFSAMKSPTANACPLRQHECAT